MFKEKKNSSHQTQEHGWKLLQIFTIRYLEMFRQAQIYRVHAPVIYRVNYQSAHFRTEITTNKKQKEMSHVLTKYLLKNKMSVPLRCFPLQLNLDLTIPGVNEIVLLVDSPVCHDICQVYNHVTQVFLIGNYEE